MPLHLQSTLAALHLGAGKGARTSDRESIGQAQGKVAILIRDLDQTVIGNPAHDLIRVGLSLATAARGSDLPGVTTASILESLMDGYENALGPAEEKEWVDAPEPVIAVLKKALQRRWKHLAEERIEDIRPKIPLGRKFWPLSDEERTAIDTLGTSEPVRKLIAHLRSRENDAELELLDAAYWVNLSPVTRYFGFAKACSHMIARSLFTNDSQ